MDNSPDMPSLREFEVLDAVIAHRTTAAAARALGVSQPAISRTVASLEGRLGRALFLRRGGLLVPTAEAAVLSEGAQRAIASLRGLVARTGPDEGTLGLNLITTTTMSHCVLVNVLPGLLAAHPRLRPQVEIASSAAVLTAVADGTADAGLLDGFAPHESLSAEVVHRGHAHVVLPRGHPLAARAEIGAAEIAKEPIVALPRRFALRARLDQAFRDAGLRPAVAVEAATALFAAEMVMRGMGVGVLNPFPLRGFYPELVFRPFTPAIAMETVVVVPSGAAPRGAVGLFVACLKQALPVFSPAEEPPT